MTKESEPSKILNINKRDIQNRYDETSEIQDQINQIYIINEYLNEALNNTIEESTKQNIKQIKQNHLKLQKKLNDKIN